jgi:hypothetical protein
MSMKPPPAPLSLLATHARLLRNALLGAATVAVLSACVVAPPRHQVVMVQPPPPAPLIEQPPPAPYYGAYWQRGYWAWNGRAYVWSNGYWRR